MNTELNEPREIVRRLVFACFILCTVASLWLSVSIFVDWNLSRFAMLFVTAATAGVLYAIGYRFFEFANIGETFVMKHVPSGLTPKQKDAYHEAEKLVQLMARSDLKPMERQELRNRLSEIVRAEPVILEMLRQEIISVHPSIRLPETRQKI